MSHDDEINRLKDIANETENFNIVNNIIYNLAAYGPKSIPAISHIMDQQPSKEVRMYGSETIRKIKQQSLSRHHFGNRI